MWVEAFKLLPVCRPETNAGFGVGEKRLRGSGEDSSPSQEWPFIYSIKRPVLRKWGGYAGRWSTTKHLRESPKQALGWKRPQRVTRFHRHIQLTMYKNKPFICPQTYYSYSSANPLVQARNLDIFLDPPHPAPSPPHPFTELWPSSIPLHF